MKYDFKKIEKKWQQEWQEKGIYEPVLRSSPRMSRGKKGAALRPVRAKPPFYNLMMFPYPSAEGLHVGNMYAFTGSDVYGRFKRMQGFDVFEPIGLDGFGIHSENYALKVGVHPMKQAAISAKRFYKQLQSIGNGFAWNERLETYDPDYYRWTQWIFIQMFRAGFAYRKRQAVNWCPKDKTVLADEQVEGGKCERCGSVVEKRELEQWFFRITKYAEKLLKNLDTLDWSEKVKIAQRNWIGKSAGALIKFPISLASPDLATRDNIQYPIKGADSIPSVISNEGEKPGISLEVFTTRADTMFGVTFLVLAPEHTLLVNNQLPITNRAEVEVYIQNAKEKAEEERLTEGKEKTGVELKGIHALNPATGEKIPLWVADYVLGGYGTGAIMAVPAHDERDFAFAKHFDLPIRNVISPAFVDKNNPVVPGKPVISRNVVECFVKHWNEDKYLGLITKPHIQKTTITGGIENGEAAVDAARREILEETGYKNVRFVKRLGGVVNFTYFSPQKNENRHAVVTSLCFQLKNGEKEPVSSRESSKHDVVWWTKEEMIKVIEGSTEGWHLKNRFLGHEDGAYTGAGILVNSEKFNGLQTGEAVKVMAERFGTPKVQYRLRDWLISRQRYWGPPIPMIYCAACASGGRGERKDMPGWYAEKDENLPVKLPMVKDFQPKGTGESPLATVKSFYEVACPACKSKARRETDVSDTFLDSAWYYLRYPNVREKDRPFDPAVNKKWFPVDMYIGGAEHSVLHLLYVRFVTLLLNDLGLVKFGPPKASGSAAGKGAPVGEPFPHFRAHGLVIKDGAKMSKSRGNVVNPDEFIAKFSADVLRMYLMFLAPFEQGGDFQNEGILGIERFLAGVRRYFEERQATKHPVRSPQSVKKVLHKAIKKVTADIESLKYNTAISQLMILFNALESVKADGYLNDQDAGEALKLIAPFAPHLTEELWHSILGRKGSIHLAAWPKWDPKFIKDDTFTLVIQLNGKVRATTLAAADLSEADARELALAEPRITEALAGKEPQRVIYVPGRLINIVL